MSGEAVLELRGISMVYPRDGTPAPLRVLDDVSALVHRGELVVVAGRSGSGKTTLLNIAAALLAPTSGAVAWGEAELAALPSRDLAALRARHLGVVFQGAALIESLTAAENVALPALPKGRRESGKRRAEALLADVGLGARGSHFPRQLSGGERQRVAIARALFNDPALLLVDEPTANLDRANADAVIDLLAELAADGKGVLVASHDEHLIRRAADVIWLEGDESTDGGVPRQAHRIAAPG
jgi:ABC-type lipoprotein export system ATPase subunit